MVYLLQNTRYERERARKRGRGRERARERETNREKERDPRAGYTRRASGQCLEGLGRGRGLLIDLGEVGWWRWGV